MKDITVTRTKKNKTCQKNRKKKKTRLTKRQKKSEQRAMEDGDEASFFLRLVDEGVTKRRRPWSVARVSPASCVVFLVFGAFLTLFFFYFDFSSFSLLFLFAAPKVRSGCFYVASTVRPNDNTLAVTRPPTFLKHLPSELYPDVLKALNLVLYTSKTKKKTKQKKNLLSRSFFFFVMMWS